MAVTWRKLAAEDDVLLITGATTGATAQAQTFTNGVVSPYIAPSSDSTTAVQIRKADKATAVVTVDTTNERVGIGKLVYGATFPAAQLHIESNVNQQIVWIRATSNDGNNAMQFDQFGTGRALYLYRNNAAPTRTLVTIFEDDPSAAQDVLYVRNDGVGNSLSVFRATASERTYLTAAGRLSLGEASPTTRLYVVGDGLFTTGLIVNESGDAAGDFRAESDTEANILWLDASADLLYLGGSTNGVQIAKGGDLTLLGTAKYERHIQIPAVITGNPANAPDAVDFGTAAGLQFATTGAKYAYFQWEIPDDWDGTDIYVEVDWFPESGAMSGTDAVRWTVEYRCIAEGESVTNGTSVTLDNGVGGDTGDYSQYQTKHSRMTMAYNDANQPITKQDHVFFKVSRDTSVSGDFGGTVTVPAFEIIYTSNSFPTN